MEQKRFMPFIDRHQNFELETGSWGDAHDESVIAVLRSCIDEFYKNLDSALIPQRRTLVSYPLTIDYPQFIRDNTHNQIYIHVQGTDWCKFSYQFLHELCHMVIDNERSLTDKFAWLEESLCELASLYFMKDMGHTWRTDPPYPNWQDFHPHLIAYAEETARLDVVPDIPFPEWLQTKLPRLFTNRYLRDINKTIAVELMPVFEKHPRLWSSIQYFKKIQHTSALDLEVFLTEWAGYLPDSLKPAFKEMCDVLLGMKEEQKNE